MASRKRLRDRMSGPVPSRATERAAAIAEPARKPPARKDRRQWCRGKEGVRHQPVIAFCPPPVFRQGQEHRCKWGTWWTREIRWHCHHQLKCGSCGKILLSLIPADSCPDYPGDPEQKAAAEREAGESAQRWSAWRAQRRPVITGPQGYRRRRAS